MNKSKEPFEKSEALAKGVRAPRPEEVRSAIRKLLLGGFSEERLVAGGYKQTTVISIAWGLEKEGLRKKQAVVCKGCGGRFHPGSYRLKYCLECRQAPPAYLRLRFLVFARDNFRCVYCGRNSTEDGVKLVTDHRIPSARGGDTTMENLVTSCTDCNTGKGDLLLKLHRIYLNRQREVSPRKENLNHKW